MGRALRWGGRGWASPLGKQSVSAEPCRRVGRGLGLWKDKRKQRARCPALVVNSDNGQHSSDPHTALSVLPGFTY